MGADIGSSGSVTGTIREDDPLPTLRIDGPDPQAEGGPGEATDIVFTVSRSGELDLTSTVDFAFSGGLVNADDFVGRAIPGGGTLSFAPGVVSQTITAQIAGDDLPDADETVRVVLSKPDTVRIGGLVAVATIRNDDSFAPTISIADAAAQHEGDAGTTTDVFTLTRAGDPGAENSVDFAVFGGSTNAADYAGGILPGGTVILAPGQAEATISVDIAGDTDIEPDEPIRIVLSDPDNARVTDGVGLGPSATTTRRCRASPLPMRLRRTRAMPAQRSSTSS